MPGTSRRRGRHRLSHVWVDNAYPGDWIAWARHHYGITIEAVARPGHMKGLRVLPRRWADERTLAWITRRCRCARDYDRQPPTTLPWSGGPPSSR